MYDLQSLFGLDINICPVIWSPTDTALGSGVNAHRRHRGHIWDLIAGTTFGGGLGQMYYMFVLC